MSVFKKILIVLIGLFSVTFFAPNSYAADFSQSYLRLDRTKANTALSGTICAKPSSSGAGTEAKAAVTFPSDFTINSTLSNWTTNTSNLPDGATAWPGIGSSANSASGQTVTFSSSDLTNTSALYCFNFTGSSSTTGSTGSKTGTITTKNSSNVTIDSNDYGLSITDSDQITVSAAVPASSTDYSVAISRITSAPTSGNFTENSDIEYQITYGSSLTYAANITLEASWSQGTIEGNGSPSVDVLSYISGSANNAYGSTVPVIDTVNRTITWTISSLPAGTTGQTVNFKVKPTSNYTGSNRVSFTASGRILFSGGSTAYKDSLSYYKYSNGASSTTPTPTPTGAPTAPIIQTADVREISDDSASIYVQTNKATAKVIRYGKSISNLNLSVSGKLATGNIINLSGLDSDIQYFFKIYATDSNENQVASDIYTFFTAKKSDQPAIDKESIVVTSQDVVLDFPGRAVKGDISSTLVIPQDSTFHIKFVLKNRTSTKKIKAIIRDKNALPAGRQVLGISTFLKKAEASTETVDLIEIEPGVYSGNLRTKPTTGAYEIIAVIYDNNGNITEEKTADLRVINKFTILNKKKEPVEAARIVLYVFSPSLRNYYIIPPQNFTFGNPVFTNRNGELDIILPKARYKAEISSLGYKNGRVEFEIGIKDYQTFPVLELTEERISIFTLIRYFYRTLNDVFLTNTALYAVILGSSIRFFDLIALIVLSSLVLIALFAFSRKHYIPFSSMVSYLYYLIDHTNKNEKYITGVVYDYKDRPIPGVNVYLNSKDSEEIISHAKTNSRGEFFFPLNKLARRSLGEGGYLIMCMAKGYKTTPLLPYEEKDHLKFKVNLTKDDLVSVSISHAEHLLGYFASFSFEFVLFISFLFELLFLATFGVIKTAPFLAVSIFNLLLWILHLREKRHSHS